MLKHSFSIFAISALMATAALSTSHTDSIPPYQYDAGVRARLAGEPLNAQCDLRFATEPTSPISISKLYYSTDGQNTWNNVDATLESGDRYVAATGSITGDANWRFYFEGAETWAGQTPVYSGTSTCRLPINWYTMWDDTPGLDSSAYLPGSGDWLDIRRAGFCMSSSRFYGIMIKANNDWRLHDGSHSWLTDLYDDNYSYILSINNPEESTGAVAFLVAWCDEADPPDVSGHVEFAPGILKAFDAGEVYVVGDANFEFAAETMFVSCNISDMTGDADFGTWPNDTRFLNVQALTMHLHVEGLTDFHEYFPDETKSGHAYYNTPISQWISSPSAPNTPPVLTGAYANYDAVHDITEVGVTYTDMDENPPEFVRVEIAASREVYELHKDQVVGPSGWTVGVWYAADVPGYHGGGESFTFSASDGMDAYTLPAGALAVAEKNLPTLSELVSAMPNPFNSACRIYAPSGSHVDLFDLRGGSIGSFDIAENAESHIWQPSADVATGVYLVRVTNDNSSATKRIVYMK